MIAALALTAARALAAVTATASPAPTSSALPVIAHVKTSAACNALRNISLPVGVITKRNDAAFTAMNDAMLKFAGGLSIFNGPTGAQIRAVLGKGPTPPGSATHSASDSQLDDTFGQPQPTGVAGASSESSAEALESGGGEPQDDSATYNGKSIISAVQIDSIAQQIFQNLVLADKYMNQSWQAYPAGQDATVDALRQRAQNLIDLQRAIADQYEYFSGTYLTNTGFAALVPGDQRSNYKTVLNLFALGQLAALSDAAAASQGKNVAPPLHDVRQFKQTGNVAALVRELVDQERAFDPEVLRQLHACSTQTSSPQR